MTDARAAVLASIRRALGRVELSEAEKAALEKRLSEPQPNLKPALAGVLLERFVAKVEAAAGSVARIEDMKQLPDCLAQLLASLDLANEVTVAPHDDLRRMAWRPLAVEFRHAKPADRVGVSFGFAGVAETGSLALVSGSQSPTTLNFLPEVHVVALPEARIVPHIEDVWSLIRSEFGAMPRAVNFVTGPSRTADIEQTIQLGAHGPAKLVVVLIEPPAGPDLTISP